VSSNGLISLAEANTAWVARSIPVTSSSTSFIAPFWTDVDLRTIGQVYYRQLTCKFTCFRYASVYCLSVSLVFAELSVHRTPLPAPTSHSFCSSLHRHRLISQCP